MKTSYDRWLKLFLFCLGISMATEFIMEWLASDFWLNEEPFSMLGLELFYPKYKIVNILSQIKAPAKIALNYQLVFDFIFMAGIYPGIASLCMMAREKIDKNLLYKILFGLAMLQPVAWAFDITENSFLLKWIEKPVIGDEFRIYHNVVIAKWLIALSGFFISITTLLLKKRKRKLIQNRSSKK